MRTIWSEKNKRLIWRELWVALAATQAEFGLVTPDQLADLEAHREDVNVERALEIEAEIHHDLMAELKTFAEQAQTGGRILHLGATSMDIEDNADVLRSRQALQILLDKLKNLLEIFAQQIDAWADLPIMAFTHLQPAEPSTLGYRLSLYAQDLLMDLETFLQVCAGLRGKGFRGAVGTSAAYAELVGEEKLPQFEESLSRRLNLTFFPVVSQVYPRKQDYQLVCALSGLGSSLYKFAFDLRFLQSPPIGELSEPFGKKQVGSSAMPFKRNPIQAEKIDSLCRALAQLPRVAWDNAAHTLLERTLDDSANRRSSIPEAFLICDELLNVTSRIMQGLDVHLEAIQRNLQHYGPFAAVERVLMALGKAGADRQEMHERLRGHALTAWAAIQDGQVNPLLDLIEQDSEIGCYLPVEQVRTLMDASQHIGDAPQRAKALAQSIRSTIL
jgi:adenylosuccinate lyase